MKKKKVKKGRNEGKKRQGKEDHRIEIWNLKKSRG